MLIKQHKSGQATIVLIVVTMMTVLGVAVASSSQSRINLSDTVYSTQSVQALSCAEAGADRALISSIVENDANTTFGTIQTLTSADTGADYTVEGCEGYSTTISSYPLANGESATILNVPENSIQEFNTAGFTGNHRINFKSNSDPVNPVNPGLAIYKYYGNQVSRTMVYCNANGSGVPSDDSEFANYQNATSTNYTIPLEDQPDVVGCSYTMSFSESNQVVVRIRPLFTDVLLQVEDFENPTGYKIVSTGTAGQVKRDINILRFFSQLSGTFDEAMVAGGSIEND